jgi:hypothetical protein
LSKFLGFPSCTPLTLTHMNANHTFTRKRESHNAESWNCSPVDGGGDFMVLGNQSF